MSAPAASSGSGSRAGMGLVALRVASTLGALAMAVTIVAALASGAPIGAEGGAIAALVWGRVSLIDLGLALVAGWAWVVWREGVGVVGALGWLVVVAVTGSLGILGLLAVRAWRAGSVAEAVAGAGLGGRRDATSASAGPAGRDGGGAH